MLCRRYVIVIILSWFYLPGNYGIDKVLSRRKRSLVFPEGTSLQLVYELAIPTLHRHPYTMAWTIGTAWELPSEAREILDKVKPVHVGQSTRPPPTTNHLYPPQFDLDHHHYLPPISIKDAAGKKVFFEPHTKKTPYSYSSYKYPIRSNNYEGYLSYDRPGEVRLHRRHRRSMFLKLEPFLLSAGLGGRSCILRTLCEAGQRRSEKRRFPEEILRVLFTLPPETEEHNEEDIGRQSDVIDHYDEAFSEKRNCDIIYSGCPKSLFEVWSPT